MLQVFDQRLAGRVQHEAQRTQAMKQIDQLEPIVGTPGRSARVRPNGGWSVPRRLPAVGRAVENAAGSTRGQRPRSPTFQAHELPAPDALPITTPPSSPCRSMSSPATRRSRLRIPPPGIRRRGPSPAAAEAGPSASGHRPPRPRAAACWRRRLRSCFPDRSSQTERTRGASISLRATPHGPSGPTPGVAQRFGQPSGSAS